MRSPAEPAAVDLLETAFELLRANPIATIAPHWIGTAPFVTSLLLFVFEMSGGAFAVERLIPWSLVVTLFWIWMNFWHSVYCGRLLLRLANEPPAPWTAAAAIRTGLLQTAIQGAKPVAVPAALAIGLPFAWTYTFFQNAGILASTPGAALASTWRRSRESASVWHKQTWTLLAIVTLLACVVFVNIAVGTFVAVQMARSLLGITTTAFSRPESFFNTTLLLFAAAATYACVDPVAKAAYVARWFAYESIRTAADVRVSLERIARITAVVIVTLAACAPASAQSPADVEELDRTIDSVLRAPEYSWRIQRQMTPKASNSTLDRAADAIAAGFRKAAEGVGRAIEWLLDLFIDREIEMPRGDVREASGRRVRIAMVLLSAILAAALLIVAWRFRRARQVPKLDAQSMPSVAAIDVRDENVSASQLEQDEWIRLSDELLANGEPRLALRAVFLGALARLQRDGLITLEPSKTNLDYDRELARRARAYPQVRSAFRRLLHAFEPCWYGNTAADRNGVIEIRSLLEELKAHA